MRHYHSRTTLEKNRWLKEAHKNIRKEHAINLQRSMAQQLYSAFTYVTKFDIYHESSQTHPFFKKPLATATTTVVKQLLVEKVISDSAST